MISVNAVRPSLQDNTADIDRLKKTIVTILEKNKEGAQKRLEVPFSQLNKIASDFRQSGFKGYGILNNFFHTYELVDFLPTKPNILPALALDLGTTHIEASLINLLDNSVLERGNTKNSQAKFGSDILSRIHFACQTENNGLQKLQETAVESINRLISKLTVTKKITPQQIRAISISGNTTMIHLLLGLNPYHMCREPYIPLANTIDPFHAAKLKLDLHPKAVVWILPSIGSYFGGDLISGILASGIDKKNNTSMLIDVGTNAEVVLGNRDWLIACAGAAGPALEGGVAKMGMSAGPGAINKIRINRKNWVVEFETIDNLPAAGICGSGMIDLVAELYLAGIVDLRGKFKSLESFSDPEQRRFAKKQYISNEEGISFIVSHAKQSANNTEVVLNQIDLDAVMRSKAAMYAILTTLAAQVGVEFRDLDKIYIAGAFGKHIDPERAITLGMLPDLPLSTFKPIGNSSLKGAELLLLDEKARKRSLTIGKKTTYIELNVNQDFMIRFSGSRFIPHTDPNLFPSVPVVS